MDLILFCVVVVIVVTAGVVLLKDTIEFRERFPPISDEEFLARCTPGTSPEIALKVRRIVAKHFAIEYERVHPSMGFVDDIGAD